MIFRHRNHDIPQLNTASLPDLIFTVLFFFMIVTHMRKEEVKVTYQVPQGRELKKLAKKSAVTYIYIGKPTSNPKARYAIQMNDRLVSAAEVEKLVVAERNRMLPEDKVKMTVSIKADKNADMGTISDVKQALRRAGALNISYSARKEGEK